MAGVGTTSVKDTNGTPQSDYDGTHVSIDVRARGNRVLNAKAGQDKTGDGWKSFGSMPLPD